LWWEVASGTTDPTDPTDLPAGHRLSHTTVVLNGAILVFREGWETILVLAAIMARFLGANRTLPPAGRCRPRGGDRHRHRDLVCRGVADRA
jgi:hypothetical protein